MDFEIKVARDDEHAVWYVRESSIPGLHAEAATYDELVDIIRDIAPELALANGLPPDSLRTQSIPLRIEHLVDAKLSLAH